MGKILKLLLPLTLLLLSPFAVSEPTEIEIQLPESVFKEKYRGQETTPNYLLWQQAMFVISELNKRDPSKALNLINAGLGYDGEKANEFLAYILQSKDQVDAQDRVYQDETLCSLTKARPVDENALVAMESVQDKRDLFLRQSLIRVHRDLGQEQYAEVQRWIRAQFLRGSGFERFDYKELYAAHGADVNQVMQRICTLRGR